jgi:hypothetical protein
MSNYLVIRKQFYLFCVSRRIKLFISILALSRKALIADCKEVILFFSMKSKNKIDIINLAQLLM